MQFVYETRPIRTVVIDEEPCVRGESMDEQRVREIVREELTNGGRVELVPARVIVAPPVINASWSFVNLQDIRQRLYQLFRQRTRQDVGISWLSEG